ncbi:MAG: nucleotidyltransferase domain-containing protein [Treponema sp.]|nr:nucleotidyltransferase domain-containing protein [Treponema sp.]
MAVDFEAINRIARDYATDVSQELPVEKAVLFGSYAKGYASEQSDIDICFFLKSYYGKRRVDLLAQILGLSGEKYRGFFFEPIIFETSEIQRDNPFVREILATGKELL